MTTEAVAAPARTRTPGAKWRSFLAAFLVIVAFILTPIGIVGYWAKQTLTDTQQYIDTVGPIGENAATKAALDPEGKRVRHWTAVAAVIAAIVAIPAAIVAGWEVAQGVVTMVMHALGAYH